MKTNQHITAVDISRDMTKTLRQKFPSTYKDIDITEGFERPCMTMEVGTILARSMNENYQYDRIPITIYYFAKNRDKGYLELLQTQAALRQLLEAPLLLGGSYLYPMDGIEFSITKSDGALITNLEYELRQPRCADDQWEIMQPDTPLNDETMEELYIANDLHN